MVPFYDELTDVCWSRWYLTDLSRRAARRPGSCPGAFACSLTALQRRTASYGPGQATVLKPVVLLKPTLAVPAKSCPVHVAEGTLLSSA